MDQEEIAVRNNLQIEFAKQYRELLEKALGQPLVSDNELMLAFVAFNLAWYFAELYRESLGSENKWYTGIEVNHPPTIEECFRHLVNYYNSLVVKTG